MPRRGGPGANRSPASSPALSRSTGLYAGSSWGSPVDSLLPSPAACCTFSLAALIVFALYFVVACAVGWLASYLSVAMIVKLLLATASVMCRSHSSCLFLLAAGVAVSYGGELLESIRFMEAAAGSDIAGLEPAEKEYVLKLAAATQELEAIPLVTKVSLFDKPNDINQSGVRVSLDSSFVGHSNRQITEKCSERPGREGRTGPPTAPKPTQLHAALCSHAAGDAPIVLKMCYLDPPNHQNFPGGQAPRTPQSDVQISECRVTGHP